VLFYCIGVLFSYSLLLFVYVCMCGLCLMIVSRRRAFGAVPEQPSSEQFEQQPGEFEEGKYNMNLLSLFNTNFILHFNSVCL
jgi:hypothetical protein